MLMLFADTSLRELRVKYYKSTMEKKFFELLIHRAS